MKFFDKDYRKYFYLAELVSLVDLSLVRLELKRREATVIGICFLVWVKQRDCWNYFLCLILFRIPRYAHSFSHLGHGQMLVTGCLQLEY